jgi:hypothetical protein
MSSWVSRQELENLVKGTCEAIGATLVSVDISTNTGIITVVVLGISKRQCEIMSNYLQEQLPVGMVVEVYPPGESEWDKAIGEPSLAPKDRYHTYKGPSPAYYGLGKSSRRNHTDYLRAELDRPYRRDLDAPTKNPNRIR